MLSESLGFFFAGSVTGSASVLALHELVLVRAICPCGAALCGALRAAWPDDAGAGSAHLRAGCVGRCQELRAASASNGHDVRRHTHVTAHSTCTQAHNSFTILPSGQHLSVQRTQLTCRHPMQRRQRHGGTCVKVGRWPCRQSITARKSSVGDLTVSILLHHMWSHASPHMPHALAMHCTGKRGRKGWPAASRAKFCV